jgi:hypothetical protein
MTIVSTSICVKELARLKLEAEKYRCLVVHGVENWSFYNVSLEEINKREERKGLFEELVENVLQICSEDGTVDYPSCREAGPSINFCSEVERSVQKMCETFFERIKQVENK